ncbi:MAG: M50 family metallopeptidase [Acidobacteriaceae bacterium]|nr:M50 family metallopeptidase [Acidobacteriaceae bacterium]
MDCPSAPAINPPLPPLIGRIAGSSRQPGISWNLFAAALGIGFGLKLLGPAWVQILLRATAGGGAEALGALFAALVAAILLHEAGHLAAAALLDFDLLGGSLGPFRAIRLHGRWSLQFSGALLSGSVIAIPRRGDSTWRPRMLAVVAGGPLMTFLTGIFAALLLLQTDARHAWLIHFYSALVELNFFLFVLGLFPNAASSRARNDASLFYALLHNTSEARQILLYHLVTQLQIAGVRPRDYPESIVRKLAEARGKPEMCLVSANAIVLWALDRGDLASADAWDKRAMDLSDFCDPKLQAHATAASACLDVIFRNNLRAAAHKFAEIPLDLLSPAWLRHRARAAQRISAGKIPEALAEIARARYSLPNRLPYYEFENMLLARLHRIAVTTQHPLPVASL